MRQPLSGNDYHHGHHPEEEQGSLASGDAMMPDNAEVGTELGSGGEYEYPAYGNGKQGLGPGLDNNTNDKDSDLPLPLAGNKQGQHGRSKTSLYDYGINELSQVIQRFHPKVRENMLRNFMEESRFQNYLTDLVKIFKNMN